MSHSRNTLTSNIDILSIKEWKKIFQTNGPKKQAGVAIFISDKRDLKAKLIQSGEELFYILIKDKLHQEEVSVLSV